MTTRFRYALLLLILSAWIASCSSPAYRYLRYRLTPDRLPTRPHTEVIVPDLTEPVTILLDDYAVPHIRAEREEPLYFAYGYMQGRDRRAQMELLRMMSLGRMRELLGARDTSGIVERLEIFSRMMGIPEDAERFLENASPEGLAILQAFSDGVNAATENEPLPMEFRLLNYTPDPWSPKDTCAIIALVSFGLAKNWEMELGRMELIVHQLATGGTIERALDIWKPRVELGPHMVGRKPDSDPFAHIPLMAPELRDYLMENHASGGIEPGGTPGEPSTSMHAALATFFKDMSSSNNWAMDGRWTGTGRGALSSDPHMPHMLPPLGYLAHLECSQCESGDTNIIGATFVGIPAIAFGTNGRVAWAATSNWADNQDLYVEKVTPGKPGHYEVNGRSVPFEVREEVFKIREKDGTFSTETRTVRQTRHGVVLNDFIERIPEHFPVVTLKRNRDPGRPIQSFLKLYRSEDVAQAQEALFHFVAMVGHWCVADVHGDVGYVGTLRLPRRTEHLGTMPVPGWVDTYEWGAFFPVADLPGEIRPERGWVATANNQVIQPDSFGHPINFEGDAPFRYRRIARNLEAGSTGRRIVEQIGRQQMDNVDAGWEAVRSLFVPAVAPYRNAEDPLLRQAASVLTRWDGTTSPDSVGPSLFHTLCAHILKNTMEDEVAPGTLRFVLTYFNIEPLAYGIFCDPSNPAWDNRETEDVETSKAVVAECFVQSVEALADAYGSNVDKWTWDRIAPWEIQHPFGTEGVLAGHVNRRVPTKGAGNTVAKHQFERKEMVAFPVLHGPVLRVMVDFNDLSGSRMSLPGGQSGRPSSIHYDDMLPLFLMGDGVSMEMDFQKIREATAGRIVLRPR